MVSPPSTWQNSDQQVLVGKQRSVLFPLNIVKITAKLCWHLSLCYLHWPPRLCSAVVGFISFCCAPSVVTSYWRPAIMLLVPGETSPTNSLPHCSHQHLQLQPLSTTIRVQSSLVEWGTMLVFRCVVCAVLVSSPDIAPWQMCSMARVWIMFWLLAACYLRPPSHQPLAKIVILLPFL